MCLNSSSTNKSKPHSMLFFLLISCRTLLQSITSRDCINVNLRIYHIPSHLLKHMGGSRARPSVQHEREVVGAQTVGSLLHNLTVSDRGGDPATITVQKLELTEEEYGEEVVVKV